MGIIHWTIQDNTGKYADHCPVDFQEILEILCIGSLPVPAKIMPSRYLLTVKYQYIINQNKKKLDQVLFKKTIYEYVRTKKAIFK